MMSLALASSGIGGMETRERLQSGLFDAGLEVRASAPSVARRGPATSWSSKIELFLSQVGASEVPVLLGGETGVGKEVLARELHQRSPRAHKPFLKLNCAALPTELVESELFGYERGAFTGAFKNYPGKFEMADGGTILLDEIGDMDVKLQAKLLQVLQDQEFLRLGATEPRRVNVRIMAATHCDLEENIRDGRFRKDLYYRLNVVRIDIPPLRDRKDEVLPLARLFLEKHATAEHPPLEIYPDLEDSLLAYEWPGNIRELENVMRRLLVLRRPDLVAGELKPGAGSQPAAHAAPHRVPHESLLSHVDEKRRQAEAEAILATLQMTLWNRKRAAALLNIEYKALLYKMKKLGIGERRA